MAYEMLPTRDDGRLFYRLDGEAAERHGMIGHLRMDFGRNGNEFYSTWFNNQSRLKTQTFKYELDAVINALRDDGQAPPFSNRSSLAAFCAAYPGKDLGERGKGYRIRTPDYSYYFRCAPRPGDYDIYCFAYDNRFLLPELDGKHELPRKSFSILPSSGELILIERNERGYSAFTSDTATPKETRMAVDTFNEAMGVTRAQEEAMLAGSLFGWDTPAAKPWNYDDRGNARQPAPVKIKDEHER